MARSRRVQSGMAKPGGAESPESEMKKIIPGANSCVRGEGVIYDHGCRLDLFSGDMGVLGGLSAPVRALKTAAVARAWFPAARD